MRSVERANLSAGTRWEAARIFLTMHRRRLLALSSILALSLLVPTSQVRAQAAAAPQHPTSTPYTGDLSIFEYKDRDQKLQIQRVFDLLGVTPGKTVADIGAGSGWLTVRAARRVGASGTVYAEDINPQAVTYIRNRAQREKLTNIKAIEGTPDDPALPPDSADVVILLKMYHEIANPQTLLSNLKPALKPGAKIGIIDRNGNGADHGLQEAVLVKEMEGAGFRRVARYDFTKADGEDYFLIFEKR